MIYVFLAVRGFCPLTCSLIGISDPWADFMLSATIGTGFGLLFGHLELTPGSGLLWGMAYGLLWWMIVPLTMIPFFLGDRSAWTVDAMRSAYPLLIGYLVGFGAILGLAYPVFHAVFVKERQTGARRRFLLSFLRAILIGGLAGLIGGTAFGAWMARVGFFPLIAGLVNSDSSDVGQMLHFFISVIIGATFGVLFHRDIRGIGSSIAWGVAYGIIWWFLGPLTIMPWGLGQDIQWSLGASQMAFPSLVGHLVYGILLGVAYTGVERLWRLLFVDSDPLNREPEGPGARSMRVVGFGILASTAGGLVFSVVMVHAGVLPKVAGLIGRSSSGTGFVVHMMISVIVGGCYGLLFRREAYTYGAGLSWGLVYGLVWWILGPLTLMPILSGADIQWGLASALSAYPLLIGHLAYGGTTALIYQWMVRRYDPGLHTDVHRDRAHAWHPLRAPDPALWILVLVMGVLLPIIFHTGKV